MIITNGLKSGMLYGGAVLHLSHDGEHTLCGRYVMIDGQTDAPLCKSCARIAGIKPEEVLSTPKGDAWELINGCKSNHTHVDTQKLTAKKYTGFELSMWRDVLSDYENGQENDACWIGTLMLIVDKPNLTVDSPKVSEAMRKGGNSNAGMIDPKNAKPARKRGCGTSEKQEKLIRDLISQIRELDSESADILETIHTDEWHNTVEWKKISPVIDALFAFKSTAVKKSKEKAQAENKSNPAEDGYYILGETFVCVKWNRAQTGQYATTWDGDSWHYDSKASYAIVRDVKAGKLARMTPEDAKRFGDLYGSCFKCSRTLTDPESIASGYGPICGGRMGW